MDKKVAIVTGASGGIGKEFVALMAKENIDEIWCIARTTEKLTALKNEFGEKIRAFPLDLTKQESALELSELLKSEQVNVSYLINNAGVGEVLIACQDVPINQSTNIINLNCTTVVSLCTICIPHMKSGDIIINLSSQSSFQPVPYLNLYASTKAFVTSYTRALNVELKKTGITATAICAGWADTDMLPKTINGKQVSYPGLTSPKLVAAKGLSDAKKGKDMSVCTFFVKYMRFISKAFPHRMVMKTWLSFIKKYL